MNWNGLIVLTAMVAVFAGWLTHIFTCLADGLWGFLIAGAICFPIGIIHGWGIWLGLF